MSGVRGWAAERSALEWLALGGGLACFGGLGWDSALWDPRLQLALHLLGVGTVVGVVLLAWRGRLEVPRTPVDLPVLALAACFALATASAMNVGMSLRAMAAVAGYALMLPAALIAIRQHPSWVGAVAGGSVLLLSIPTLVALLVRRAEWVLAGGPGVPPLRLGGEGTPFGSVAVPPFVIWPAWALAGLIEHPGWRWLIRTGLVVVGVPLTVLSGSRSAWLAIGVTALVAGVPWLWGRRLLLRSRLRLTPGGVLYAIGTLVVAAIVVAVALPRLLAVTSLLYRVSLWRDTLTAWATDPVLGIGPGFMPIARQAAAPDFSFPVRQPHSHNLPLGVLGDAGILGLLAGIALIATLVWVAGPWRTRSRIGRQAAFVLLGIGIGSLFEDVTFEPNFSLLAIGLVALALTDAGRVRWTRLPAHPAPRLALASGGLAAGVVLAAGMVTSDAGGVAYRAGIDAVLNDDWGSATEWFERSVAIDPWHPAGPKALAVAAEVTGNLRLARDAARQATRLNPGDAASWTNLALTCAALNAPDCARQSAFRASATTGFGELDQLNAAYLFEFYGDTTTADEMYRRSLLSHRATAFGPGWPRKVPVGQVLLGEEVGDLTDLNRLLAWWLMEEPIEPDTLSDPNARALGHAILGDRDEAAAWISRAIEERPEDPTTWQVAAVLHRHWGSTERAAYYQRVGEVVSGGPYPDEHEVTSIRPVTHDLSVFREYPGDELIGSAARLLIQPPMPWALEATLP